MAGSGPRAYHGIRSGVARSGPCRLDPRRICVGIGHGVARNRPNRTASRACALDRLRRAVEIYLAIAYRGAEPPPAVRRRLDWTPGLDPDALLPGPPFERVGKAPTDKPILALRLGNARYPHMKLQIQPWDAPTASCSRSTPTTTPWPSTPTPPTPTPSWPSRPRTSGSRSRSSRPGTRPACPPSPATSATTWPGTREDPAARPGGSLSTHPGRRGSPRSAMRPAIETGRPVDQ